MNDLSALIHRRRAIFPKTYIPGKAIGRSVIEQILENANQAPTHRLTEPWRFQVFHSEKSRHELSAYMSDFFRRHTAPELLTEEKVMKAGENALLAGAVIAIILHRDPEARIPEWEEIASVAMAVQNMWLSCTAINLGCYWSSPKAALEANEFLGLAENERCLGLFYMGWHDMPAIPGKREPIEDKVIWR